MLNNQEDHGSRSMLNKEDYDSIPISDDGKFIPMLNPNDHMILKKYSSTVVMVNL